MQLNLCWNAPLTTPIVKGVQHHSSITNYTYLIFTLIGGHVFLLHGHEIFQFQCPQHFYELPT